MLRRDVRFLRTRYAYDVKGNREGRIIIRYGFNNLLTFLVADECIGTKHRRIYTALLFSQKCSKKRVAISSTPVQRL